MAKTKFEVLSRLSPEDQRHLVLLAAARAKARADAPPIPFDEYLFNAIIENKAEQKLTQFERWPHLEERARSWAIEHNSEVILKARQLGISWAEAGYAAWKARQPNSRVLLISQGYDYAVELLDKVKLIAEKHPQHPSRFTKATEQILRFKDGGEIRALPSTKDAGRSFTASLVIADEAAFHEWGEENFKAYFPTIADGGQVILSSTSNGPQGFFYHKYMDARSGLNGLKHVFIPATARPDRDAGWIARTRKSMGDKEFLMEYPQTDNEAWVSTAGLVLPEFDPALHVAPPPRAFAECAVRVAGIDPGGDDPTVVSVWGAYPGKQNGDLHYAAYDHMYNRHMTSVSEMANYLYQWPNLNAVYVDAPAKSPLISELRLYGIPAYAASKERGPGLTLFSSLLKNNRIVISPSCKDGIQEFLSYWWNPDSQVKFATRTGEGHHADFIDSSRYAIMGIESMVRQTLGSSMPKKPGYKKRRG